MEECSEEYFPASIHTLEFFPRFVWRLGASPKGCHAAGRVFGAVGATGALGGKPEGCSEALRGLGHWVPLGATLIAAARHSLWLPRRGMRTHAAAQRCSAPSGAKGAAGLWQRKRLSHAGLPACWIKHLPFMGWGVVSSFLGRWAGAVAPMAAGWCKCLLVHPGTTPHFGS